ncbi:hypothetical protein [Candidatus Villigracilis affinis]|nr:hypothetical protein [Anaerolineales bacterium]
MKALEVLAGANTPHEFADRIRMLWRWWMCKTGTSESDVFHWKNWSSAKG